MAREFVHLHNHTEYSLLDGASQVDDLAALIAAQGSPAVAMTDHGNLFGAVSFFKAMRKAGPHPILGCEVYMAPGSRRDRKVIDQTEIAYHLVLLVENEIGYRNLCKLVTAGYMEGFYYKPRIDWELLRAHHEGLICLSGCLQGEIAKGILYENPSEVRRRVKAFHDLFGDRFYLEIQANGLPEQIKVNRAKIELSKEFGIPLVATNDNHYLTREDAFPHDCLLCIGTHKTLEDPDRLKFPNDQFYVKHPDEMWEAFADVPAALENTLRIAERCHFAFQFGKFHLPRFAEAGQDLDQLLAEAAQAGLEQRFKELEATGKLAADPSVYRERLDYELGVIKDMGFSGYFLIVSDFIRWAKSQAIPVGPGRGSAAGSLVSYVTRITDLDPLRFGLLFERFLNPERKSMPDIDVDICMNRRGEVIEYVSQRYGGADHVAQIAAFGTAKGRQIFKDVGRVYGLTFAETDRMTKLMPAPPAEFQLADLLDSDPELRNALKADKRLEEVYRIAMRLEGITRHASVHAAGLVISDKPLVEYLPLFKGEHGESVTQFEMSGVEEIGLVKFDFLGLKTLTVMHTAVELARTYQGADLDLDTIPEDDPKTFELLQQGHTTGVFQLESEGMRRLLKQLKPESLEEVIAVTALYRPGPMQSGMVDEFVARKHGRKQVDYMLPQLEPILSETYGVIVYQEQVMEIARVLAGYSLGEADILRKAMGKKDPAVMKQQRGRFVDGCVARGITAKAAETLFDQIVEFAGYGFNKSHSAAYGLIAYRTAWLKTHYPVAFMAALMQADRDNSKKLIPLLREARRMGIEILPPDINQSALTFTPDGERIRFGLAAIKNVGEKPVAEILAKRAEGGPFTSLSDFLLRLDPGTINRKIMENFVRSGALDTFGIPRRTLFENMDRILEWTAARQTEKVSGQGSLFSANNETRGDFQDLVLDDCGEWTPAERAEGERETIGFYLSVHPLDGFTETIARFANTTLSEDDLSRFGDRSQIAFGGVITGVRMQNHPKGRRAYVTIEDHEGIAEVGVFGDAFHEHRDLINVGLAVFVEAELMLDADLNRRLFGKTLIPLKELEGRLGRTLHIHMRLEDLDSNTPRRLAALIRNHPGKLEVVFHVFDEHRNEILVRLPDTTAVTPGEELRRGVYELLGERTTIVVEGALRR